MEKIAKNLANEVKKHFSSEELSKIYAQSVTRIQNFFKNFYQNEREKYEKIFEENIDEMLDLIADAKYRKYLFTMRISYWKNNEKNLRIEYCHHYCEREVKMHFEYVIFLDQNGNFQEKDEIIFPYNPFEDK